MAGRRNEIAMTEEEARAFLEEGQRHGHSLQVASIGAKGHPHLVAMWYTVIDGLIHFNTYGKSQKIVNLRRNPKITCMLEAGETYNELRGVVVEGTAEIIDNDPELSYRVMSGSVRNHWLRNPMYTASEEQRRKIATKRAVVRVRPVRMYSWDHRKLGGVY